MCKVMKNYGKNIFLRFQLSEEEELDEEDGVDVFWLLLDFDESMDMDLFFFFLSFFDLFFESFPGSSI